MIGLWREHESWQSKSFEWFVNAFYLTYLPDSKSLSYIGPKIRDIIPTEIKNAPSLSNFKESVAKRNLQVVPADSAKHKSMVLIYFNFAFCSMFYILYVSNVSNIFTEQRYILKNSNLYKCHFWRRVVLIIAISQHTKGK